MEIVGEITRHSEKMTSKIVDSWLFKRDILSDFQTLCRSVKKKKTELMEWQTLRYSLNRNRAQAIFYVSKTDSPSLFEYLLG